MTRISDAMFRSRTLTLKGQDGKEQEDLAFRLMREGLTATVNKRQHPRMSVYADQIVWGRSRYVSTWQADGQTPRPTV